MKRALSFILIFILAVAIPTTAFAENNSAVSQARNGVVRVVVTDPDGKILGHGTGFAVGVAGEAAQVFVTNNHVAEVNPDGLFIVLDNVGEDGTIIKATVVARSKSPDLAILAVDEPIRARTPLVMMPSQFVEPAETVFMLGFPGSSDNINDYGGMLPSTIDDITITKGIISKVNLVNEGTVCYQTDAAINGGNSGGPLITEDGYVIGVNTFYANVADEQGGGKRAEGTNGSIHIDYVMDFLNQSNIPFTSADGSQAPKDDRPVGPAPIATQEPAPAPIAAQPTAEPIAAQPTTAPVTQEPVSPSGGSNYNYIGIAAVGAVIGLAIVFLSKKKKGSNGQSNPPVYASSPAAGSQALSAGSQALSAGPQLLCTQGHFRGNSFPISGSITIGRDPKRCNIVLPASTPGISSLHCEVRNDNGQMLLIDRGSSYGTFLADGTKLSANAPYALRFGEAFYLADRKNEFKLD